MSRRIFKAGRKAAPVSVREIADFYIHVKKLVAYGIAVAEMRVQLL
ncbi:MAG: hypothetical protein LBL31_01995 [Spirochaetaceae bacterium]|nr:hypothetical protein [Spirochaetaceae bacterium]